MLKRLSTLITAAAALAVATLACAVQPQPGQPEHPSTRPAPSSPESTPPHQPPVDPNTMPSGQSPPDPSTASSAPASPSNRLAAIVPAGMSTREACLGFDNVKECATALHAAHNLNLPFAVLKTKLTDGQKLSAAIHDLKPEADAGAEARKAEAQAQRDLSVAAPQG